MPPKNDANCTKPRETVGECQKTYLITYMQTHTFFARRQITKLGPAGNKKYNDMWRKLALKLNEIGPAVKTESQWIKTWTSLRLEAKGKVVKFFNAYKKTGNNTPTEIISEHDLQITNIFGKYGTGVAVTPELGFMHVNVPKSINAVDVYNHSGLNDHDITSTNIRPTNNQFNFLIEQMEDKYKMGTQQLHTDAQLINFFLPDLNKKGNVKDLESWTRTWQYLMNNARKNAALNVEHISGLLQYHQNALQFYLKYKHQPHSQNSENNCNLANQTKTEHQSTYTQQQQPTAGAHREQLQQQPIQTQQLPATVYKQKQPIDSQEPQQWQATTSDLRNKEKDINKGHNIKEINLKENQLPETSRRQITKDELEHFLASLSDDEYRSGDEYMPEENAKEESGFTDGECIPEENAKEKSATVEDCTTESHKIRKFSTYDQVHSNFLQELKLAAVNSINDNIEKNLPKKFVTVNDISTFRNEMDEKFAKLMNDFEKKLQTSNDKMKSEMQEYIDTQINEVTDNVAKIFDEFIHS